jgi:hypothetical protein
MHNSRRANVVGFGCETAIKKNLPIVSRINAVDFPDGPSILLVIYKGIYNEHQTILCYQSFNLENMEKSLIQFVTITEELSK